MPIKLLQPFRLVNPYLPVTRLTQMKVGTSVQSSRGFQVFSRVFPFKLRYNIALGSRDLDNGQIGVRRFSSGSFRSRAGSGFGRMGERGGVGASKSLVEDEAELSDWVSELRTGSYRGRVTRDEEAEENRGRRGRFKDRESNPAKRRRDSDSDEFGDRRRVRGHAQSFSRNSRAVGRYDNGFKDDDAEKFDARGKNRGFRRESGNMSGGRRAGREMNSEYKGARAGERMRNGWKGSRKPHFVEHDNDDEDEEEEEEKFMGVTSDLLTDEDSDEEDGAKDDEYEHLLRKSRSSLFPSESEASAGNSLPSTHGKSSSESYLSETRFDQCSISPLSLKGIKDAGYQNMTVVQEATLPVILKGKDVLAKARTGTGKTVAFLLPSIEVVVNSPPIGRDQKRPPILVLVVCPTRELASQAAAEANTLLKYHPSIGVQVVIGGTRLALEQKRMQTNPCQILVATPGRLRDHLENTAGFPARLMGVKVLVLDEADHLLDMGFRKDIEKIIAAVPKQRQTLLFSATVPEEVRQICHIALKRDHEFINTVQEGSEETHSQVRQMHMVAPLDKHFPLLYTLLKEHIADNVDYKVLVFCTTAMVTRMVADLLGELNLNVREIHSRKPQSYRTRVSDEFRKSKGLILVTSDVSARGVDYPDVTLVIQIGLPADREQYIHRLGRTGRKGKEGLGVLLLAPWEEFFLATVKDLPLTKAPILLIDPETKKKVERALSHVEMKNKEAAYQAWLGYYNSNKSVGRDKYRLVELANEFSRSMGLDNPPAIPKLVLGKMGLRNIPGLRSK